jgi:hypothetical protein
MYFIGLIVILLIALAIFFSPIFAIVLMVLFLIGLGAYKFLAGGTEPEHGPVGESPAAGAVMSKHEAAERGMWGEKRPEEQTEGGESPS